LLLETRFPEHARPKMRQFDSATIGTNMLRCRSLLRQTLLILISLGVSSCSAQDVKGDHTLPPQVARRIEVMFRSRADLPPESEVQVGDLKTSDFPGFDSVSVTFSTRGKTSSPYTFLLSKDRNKVIQYHEFPLERDPRTAISDSGGPARGGGKEAPVLIVVFNDLECPYCARLYSTLFPNILAKYKDQVRIVYRDFPIDQHPWAMHAAVSTNCLRKQNESAYWTALDKIYSFGAGIGGANRSLSEAKEAIDQTVLDIGKSAKLDSVALNECVKKQDDDEVKKEEQAGEALGINSTPTFYINGAKFSGAESFEFIVKQIDKALAVSDTTPHSISH
jgi:protein-disulfide isomerase